jgi:flagellar biosynthesis/type III secretory pathway M-ring protein FliF/YscJ
MTRMLSALFAAVTVVTEDPPPFDPNTVTPGIVGFLATFGVAVVVVLLVIDMVRRVRRVNLRQAVKEKLDAEEKQSAADQLAADEDLKQANADDEAAGRWSAAPLVSCGRRG